MTALGSLTKPARIFVACVVAAGASAVAHAAYEVCVTGVPKEWLILAGLTLLSGSITVKVPSVPATISVSETFVFTSVLLFGPAPGILTVALDGLVISLWLRKKQREVFRAAFNVAAPAASIWVSSHFFYLLTDTIPLALRSPAPITNLLLPLTAFTTLYFLLNSWLIAVAIGFENRVPAFRVWRENFFWLGLNYFGGASVAALLVASSHRISWTTLGIIVPLLVISYLTYKTAMGRLEDTTRHLSHLNLLHLSTIETLARAIDARDGVTHDHIRRVQVSAVSLAKRLGVSDDSLLRAIEAAALLHDLGKLRIPEHILNKPGRLTPEEFEQIKTHSRAGAEILSSIEFPYPVVPIVRHHHENWNGTGYPDGLSGTEIPIGARILAVVDCFDALTSDRPYRPALGETDALEILVERRGTMYDPVIVDTFLALHQELSDAIPDGTLQASIETSRTRAVTPGWSDSCSLSPKECRAPLAAELGDRNTSSIQRGYVAASAASAVRTLAALPEVSSVLAFVYRADDDDIELAAVVGEQPPASLLDGRAPLTASRWVASNRHGLTNVSAVLDLGPAAVQPPGQYLSSLSRPVSDSDGFLGVISLYSRSAAPFTQTHVAAVDAHGASLLQNGSSFLDSGGGDRRAVRFVVCASGQTAAPDSCGTTAGALSDSAIILVRTASHSATDVIPDQTTIALSAVLKVAVRSADCVVRLRSDEILALLPGAGPDVAQSVCERVIRAIVTTRDATGLSPDSLMLVSFATCPLDGETLEDLIAAARLRSLGIGRIEMGTSASLH